MRKPRCFIVLLCLFLASSAWGQEMAKRLTNQDIIAMVAAGLSDDVIIAKIRSVSGADGLKFDTSVDGLKALKAAKVSEAVIKVMINPAPPGFDTASWCPGLCRPQSAAPGSGRLLEGWRHFRSHPRAGDKPGEGGRPSPKHLHLRPARPALGRLR